MEDKEPLIGECQICFRNFVRMNIHHINGNHDDNRNRNLIKICRDCHTTIHKKIGYNKFRHYELNSDEAAILKIYKLRFILWKSAYGTMRELTEDDLSKTARMILKRERLAKKWALVKEIRFW